MSKKKHPEHVNHERWLVSYADFITLLFAFFVVLFASGQSDKRKQVKLAQAMQSAFNHNGIFDPHTKTPPLTPSSDGQNTSAAPIILPLPSATSSPPDGSELTTAADLREVIRSAVAAHELPAGTVVLRSSPEGLVISLREAGFFASGSAEVRSRALNVLKTIAATLPHQPMRIEGHTDNVPIHTAQFASNWELSTARAASVTRLLITQRAAAPTQLSAAGYAEFHPLANNMTEAGRTQNRRVDIILLTPRSMPNPNHDKAASSAPSKT